MPHENLTFLLVASNVLTLVTTTVVVLGLVLVLTTDKQQQHGRMTLLRELNSCCDCNTQQPLFSPNNHNVSMPSIMGHLEELQLIADSNGGYRHAGSKGFDESSVYVQDQLRLAGYTVEIQRFDALNDCEWVCCCGTISTSEKQFSYSGDFWEAWCSPFGAVEATTTFVVSSGCTQEDFLDFPGKHCDSRTK
jgi:hypothetical protein